MDQLRNYLSKHAIVARAGAAILYGVLVGFAMNFLEAGQHIFQWFQWIRPIGWFLFSTNLLPVIILLVNIPMTILAWIMISRRLAFLRSLQLPVLLYLLI